MMGVVVVVVVWALCSDAYGNKGSKAGQLVGDFYIDLFV
jgi:hypothetical protein